MDDICERASAPINSPPSIHRNIEPEDGVDKKHRLFSGVKPRHLAILLIIVALQFISITYTLLNNPFSSVSSAPMKDSLDMPRINRRRMDAPPPTFDVIVTIYAYDRPRHLLALLKDVARDSDAVNLRIGVNVIDDASLACTTASTDTDSYDTTSFNHSQTLLDITATYSDSASFLRSAPCAARSRFRLVESYVREHPGWRFYSSYYRHGRHRYWHLIRVAHELLEKQPIAKYYIFLPDDDRLAQNFFMRTISQWEAISDPRKTTLMLHVEATRERTAVWTNLRPRRTTDGLYRIGWVESGNFIATQELLNLFNWSFPRVSPQRWIDNPPISSGVGALMSETLHSIGRRMFRTTESLVAHVGVTESKMNAAFRKPGEPSLVTKYFADGDVAYEQLVREAASVTASLSSTRNREASLRKVVKSLSHQVDRLNVYLNGYDSIPSFLNVPFLNVHCCGNDLGDVGKFFWHNEITTEFHATVDDDIIYPDDYIQSLVELRRSFGTTPVIVGVHGIRMVDARLKRGYGYYGSRTVYMGVKTVAKQRVVHILGTGTVLYRPKDVGKFDLNKTFKFPNMADIWLGVLAQKLSLPMVVIRHNKSWITEVPGTSVGSIYVNYKQKGDETQSKVAMEFRPWKLNYPQKNRMQSYRQ